MRRPGLNVRALRERARWNKKFRRGGKRRRKHEVPFLRQPNYYAREHALLVESAPLYDPQAIATPEEELIAREDAYTLHRLIDTLPAREARVIRLNYGVGCEPHTLREIGEKFGVTGNRAMQIACKGLRRLQHPVRAKWLENPHGARWRSQAHRNLYVPDWQREEEAAAAEAAKIAVKKAEKAAAAERRRLARERAWEDEVREAREREAAIERQLERERQWLAMAPLRAARAAERERELALRAARAREQWHKEEALREWAYAESQRAAAALRIRRAPTVPVYAPTYNAAFRRPIYTQVKHG